MRATKVWSILLATCFGAGAAAGCGQGAPKADPAAEPQARPVTIQFWTIALKPTFNDYLNGLISKYQQANPGVTVAWTDLPFNAIQDKLLTAIAAGDAPDVVNLNTEMTMNLAVKGALLDIDKVASPQQKAAYFDTLWRSAQYRDGVYALPWYAAGNVLIYNREIFRKAGLDPNRAPQTPEELAEYARRIKAETGIYGFMPENRGLQMLFMAGVPILSPDKARAAFNTPEAAAKLAWFAGLFREQIVPPDAVNKDFQTALQRYMGGQLAMVLTGPQFLRRIKENAPAIYRETWVAPWPQDAGGAHVIPLMNLVVPKLSKHHQQAVDFAAYVTSDDNQLAFARIVPILPSARQAASDDFFKARDTASVEAVGTQIAAAQLEHGADLALGVGARQGEINQALTEALQQAALGQASPEAALGEAEAKVNLILSREN